MDANVDVDVLGVHRSVEPVFPPAKLRDELRGTAVREGSDDGAGKGPDDAGSGGTDATPAVRAVGDDGVADCDAVVTLEHRPALFGADWVHSIQAGADRFPLAEFERRGVALTNSAGIHGTTVGETVAGYALAFARRLHRHRDRQRDREWERPAWDAAFTLDGDRACVVGLGTLRSGAADRLGALGMDVVGVRRTPDPVEGVERVYPPARLTDAVSGARLVVIAVPLTDDTRGLVGHEELAAMEADSCLINVARGPVLDQSALVGALRSGSIAGAALDVTDPEPLPAESPLWDFEDVILTPHCAAYTRDYYADIAALVRGNLRRIRAGEPMHNRVV